MNISYKCLQCGGVLLVSAQNVICGKCNAQWPIRNGVPSYDSAKYFGEVSQSAMQQLVTAAEKGNWLMATQALFKESNREMYEYISDLNRASWIPLLPVGPKSTVLDVGAGLGVLTHALALQFEKVVSIEPITERVHFTKVRIEQEGLKNVDLLQTTLDTLPFFEKTFDLIVLNGILEWVGEWHQSKSPRDAQRSTLLALQRLLKPGGLILIGIENRIGWDSFLGRVDHPGTRFTSLMPRWMASLYLKMRRPGFYRTFMDSDKGYRTYTYSPRGYMKLLGEAGFMGVDIWWPYQGYNLPYVMYKASDYFLIQAHFVRDRNFKNRVHGHSWLRELRDRVLVNTGLLKHMFPDVIVMARTPNTTIRPENEEWPSLPDEIRRVVSTYRADSKDVVDEKSCHSSVLMSRPFRNKAIVLVSNAEGNCCAIAKVANVRLSGASTIESAYRWLQHMHKKVAALEQPLRGSVPAPLELLRVGSLVVSVESVVQGCSFEDICMSSNYFQDRKRVEHHLRQIVLWLSAVKPVLETLRSEGVEFAISKEWWEMPSESGISCEIPTSNEPTFVQHGDFFPDNVFLSENEGQVSAIDWDQCGDGYPPLFDWFCLVTGMYYIHQCAPQLSKGETVYNLSFYQTYFEQSWFSDMVVDLSFQLCDQFGLKRAMLPEYFRYYLAVRYRQFEYKSQSEGGSEWRDRHRGFYDYFVEHENENIFNAKVVA